MNWNLLKCRRVLLWSLEVGSALQTSSRARRAARPAQRCRAGRFFPSVSESKIKNSKDERWPTPLPSGRARASFPGLWERAPVPRCHGALGASIFAPETQRMFPAYSREVLGESFIVCTLEANCRAPSLPSPDSTATPSHPPALQPVCSTPIPGEHVYHQRRSLAEGGRAAGLPAKAIVRAVRQLIPGCTDPLLEVDQLRLLSTALISRSPVESAFVEKSHTPRHAPAAPLSSRRRRRD